MEEMNKTESEENESPESGPGSELNELLNICKNNLQSYDEQLITKAFHWCMDAHKNIVRKSGEPYYTHPVSVALIVAGEIPLDDISVISALLHDILLTQNRYNINDIRSEFGPTIAEIIEGITKIQRIESKAIEQIENYRKLLLSLFKDVRIILIKLADVLHNMRTLDFVKNEKKLRYSKEAVEVYVPFAHRFGLGKLKLELEDLAFKYLNKKEYARIERRLELSWQEREDYIRIFTKPIKERLAKVELINKKKIPYEIYGRAKHIFSIFNKMILRDKDMDELYDLFAVRIILDTKDSGYCFLVYGILSEIYKPVPGTFKNYISDPKKNGYKSIHTAVVGPDDKYVEVQIRTKEMHDIAEKGVAAHFMYKRGFLPAQSVLDDKNLEEWMNLVRNVFENIGEDEAPEQLLESVRKNLYLDEIYVFTPAKEFRILPKDATPLDFAFNIHTDVGMHCIGAKINGRVVPIDYKLQSGDQIEILTSKHQKPLKKWLKFVVTQRAKYYLQKYFKDEKKETIFEGKSILDIAVEKIGGPVREFELEKVCKLLNIDNKNDLFYRLGSESLQIPAVIDILEKIRDSVQPVYDSRIMSGQAHHGNGNNKSGHSQQLSRSLEIVYAGCCKPIPGDTIASIITPDKKMTIHRNSCTLIKKLRDYDDPAVSDMKWDDLPQAEYLAQLRISGKDDKKVINDITNVIFNLNNSLIKSFKIDNNDEGFEVNATLNIDSREHLNNIIDKISGIEGIRSVERVLQ